MYIDAPPSSAGAACLNLDLSLDLVALPRLDRQWRVRVSQHRCGAPSAAPEGCQRYFSGDVPALVPLFVSEDEVSEVCVRRERGNEKGLCWRLKSSGFGGSSVTGCEEVRSRGQSHFVLKVRRQEREEDAEAQEVSLHDSSVERSQFRDGYNSFQTIRKKYLFA